MSKLRFTCLAFALAQSISATAATDIAITPTFDTAFRWSVQASAAAAQINPKIELRRGDTYVFDVTTSASHPFWINTQAGTGTAFAYTSPSLSANGVSAPSTITFTVPADAPDQLFYNCEFHGTMSGVLDIPLFKDGFEASP